MGPSIVALIMTRRVSKNCSENCSRTVTHVDRAPLDVASEPGHNNKIIPVSEHQLPRINLTNTRPVWSNFISVDQDTDVSRYHEASIKVLPENPRSSWDYSTEGFLCRFSIGPPNMPRGVSISYIR